MGHEVKIHQTQTTILKELLFLPSARFSELRKKTELESDFFKFHLNKLVEVGYVEKVSNGEYRLTPNGKEYANKIDTDNNILERQPKSAVIVVLQDENKLLLQERLKHPYFGFWGYPGGKIRWGETILQAAARELDEETGLNATLTYQGVYHEHVRSAETGEILEDKIFHIISGTNPHNTLKAHFDGGRNQWLTIEEINNLPKKYLSTDIETSIGLGSQSFIEETQTYTNQEF
jgi:ADP-ribose pyrophosphatase YjhB (NUDIX family)